MEAGWDGNGAWFFAYHAKAKIVGCAQGKCEQDNSYAADGGDQPFQLYPSGAVVPDRMGDFGKRISCQAKCNTSQDHLCQQYHIEMQEGENGKSGLNGIDVIMCMMDTPGGAGDVCQDAGYETGHQRIVFDPAQGEDFQRKNGSGDGCAEDRSEACGDPGSQQYPGVFAGEMEFAGKEIGQAAAYLYGCAFPAGGAAKKVGDDCRHEHEGGHPDGDAASWCMDLVHDQVVTGLGIPAQVFV